MKSRHVDKADGKGIGTIDVNAVVINNPQLLLPLVETRIDSSAETSM
jgi:hypothetical protein